MVVIVVVESTSATTLLTAKFRIPTRVLKIEWESSVQFSYVQFRLVKEKIV